MKAGAAFIQSSFFILSYHTLSFLTMPKITFTADLALSLSSDWFGQSIRIARGEFTQETAAADADQVYRPKEGRAAKSDYDWVRGKHSLDKDMPDKIVKAFLFNAGIRNYGQLIALTGEAAEELQPYVRELIYQRILVVG